MKAWGTKKIIRSEEVPEQGYAPWSFDQFSGFSVQRPHLHSFEEPAEEPPVDPAAEVEPAELPEDETAAAESVPEEEITPEAELEALREAARTEGYQAGHAEGFEKGRAAGDAAGRESGYAEGKETGQTHGRTAAANDVAQFQALLAGVEAAVADYEEKMAKPILDIALAVAKQVMRTTLVVEPDRILAVIREALNSLPELQGSLKLELHPDDLALVKVMLATEALSGQWRLEPNPDIERGGCLMSSANIDLDLTVATRWKRIVEALGRGDVELADDNELGS
ncbi:flagellar assembly protein FliH [Chitinimonas sp. PSY-7]|uniref:flagellar assembly protein FliH n=1 Tax=Chitinimonas sp. PSY-7 TaxID=3459088 RepID=UPI00403FCC40